MNQCLEQKRMLVDIEAVGIPVSRQCALLDILRSSYYFNPCGLSQENFRLMQMIDKIYTKHPFYGSTKITDALKRRGYEYNHKRIARLMRIMAIQAVYPKRNLSRQNHSHAMKNLEDTLIYANFLSNIWNRAHKILIRLAYQ